MYPLFLLLLLAASLVAFLKRNNEVPFILFLFLLFGCYYRLLLIQSDNVDWVIVNYGSINFEFTDRYLQIAQQIFFLGTGTWMLSSYLTYTKPAELPKPQATTWLLPLYLNDHHSRFLLLCFLYYVSTFPVHGSITGNVAYGNSYAFLYSLAIGGTLPLLLLFNRHQPDKTIRLATWVLFGIGAYLSYNATIRYQMVSWIIAVLFLYLDNVAPLKKLLYIVAFVIPLIIIFSLAGASRQVNTDNLSVGESIQVAWQRLLVLEDLNMLDGLVMLLNVYPEHLPFAHGMNHFEILLRPIPRALWAGKPVGGYVNKLGLQNSESTTTVGISETIYGTFYSEGGLITVILFSLLYGWFFNFMLAKAKTLGHPDLQKLAKGILLSALIPLMRGGDLPGIVAFIGMTWWPCILFYFLYKKTENFFY